LRIVQSFPRRPRTLPGRRTRLVIGRSRGTDRLAFAEQLAF
jgi:hypothetical protein